MCGVTAWLSEWSTIWFGGAIVLPRAKPEMDSTIKITIPPNPHAIFLLPFDLGLSSPVCTKILF
jgi:hypothetical protein